MNYIATCFLPRLLFTAFLLVAGLPLAHAQLSVSLTTSIPSGQPVGTKVILGASVEGAGDALPVYQFAVRPISGEWRLLRDFSIWSHFGWVTLEEGMYELRVIAAIAQTDDVAEAVVPYEITSRVSGFPAVTATSHPLVALYSAPSCLGGIMWIRFRRANGIFWETTSFKPCNSKSLNFYVAGMRGNTTYVLQQERLIGGRIERGPLLTFRTGVPQGLFEEFAITDPPDLQTSLTDGVLLSTYLRPQEMTMATDLEGNVIWYYPEIGPAVLRPIRGGSMLVRRSEFFSDQILREIDLAGNIIRETNARRVSWQLTAMGQDPIGSFHHEAIRLPNGHTVVLGSVERILTDVQGPGPVNVLGDMIIDLDENFQVTWAWNAFDFLDPSRQAILGQVCESEGPGCPPLFLDQVANDWLHANSLFYVPEDGGLLISFRHQDWVVKIDFQGGVGSGEVLWRLGNDGDFTAVSDDAWPWFSHQHDAETENGLLVLYDNGNTRVEGPEGIGGNSRGQAWLLDETALTATLIYNFDLGGYASALGSAQRLSNGNYHFNSGFLGTRDAPFAESIEVLPNGERNFVLYSDGAVYRSFRMQSLYRP